jgi:hypothetical protein
LGSRLISARTWRLPGLFSEHVSDIDNVYIELELELAPARIGERAFARGP